MKKYYTFQFVFVTVVCYVMSTWAGESVLLDGHWEYLEDEGQSFSQKQNGYNYGWTGNQTAGNANSPESPSEKYDTYVAMPSGASWEVEVPNGIYRVLLVAGDPVTHNARLHVLVEGVTALDQEVEGKKFWATGNTQVEVKDGRLTVQGGAEARNNHLLYLHLYSPMYGYYTQPTQAVTPLKINLGGPAVNGFKADQKWTENADFGFVPVNEEGEPTWKHDTEGKATYCADRTVEYLEVPDSVVDIPDTENDLIHRTVLSQGGAKKDKLGPGFHYKIRLPNGSYEVTILVTNWSVKRTDWTEVNLHLEDKVQHINPGELTDKLYGAASVTIPDVEVNDGIMDIIPYFIGNTYSLGASIAGIIVEGGPTSGLENGNLLLKPVQYLGSDRFGISFYNDSFQKIRMDILGIDGRMNQVLADRFFEPGEHKVQWNSTGQSGAGAGRGVYMLRIQQGNGNSRVVPIVNAQ